MADLRLQIQTLGGFREQTLVLLHVASLQGPSAAATPGAVREMYLKLHLPPPANVSQHLAQLKQEQTVMQPSTGLWAVTPVGLERIRNLMASVSPAQLRALLETDTDEATFGEARHHLIPPALAPSEFLRGIGVFLEGHPFDRNVFGISRFPRSEDDVVETALAACRVACAKRQLEFHTASDRSVDDSIPKNVVASMWACKFGIAILENRADEGLNYNVIFEVGAMVSTGRRCLLLKDQTSPPPPTDLVGHIYVPVDIADARAVSTAVEKWASETWGA